MAGKMTALEIYAQRCSISYAEMPPERLAAIIMGESPKNSEIASLEQGLLETAPDSINRSLADALAAELGITREALETRCLELTGEKLGSSVPSIIAQLIEIGLVARYGNDLDALNRTRQAVRDALLAKGWVLPPYTDETA